MNILMWIQHFLQNFTSETVFNPNMGMRKLMLFFFLMHIRHVISASVPGIPHNSSKSDLMGVSFSDLLQEQLARFSDGFWDMVVM